MEQTSISPAESAVGALTRFLPPDIGIARLIAVTRALASLNRDQLGGTIEALVTLLDAVDGNADLELNGDELDGSLGEDDFVDHSANWKGEPGCPISDPDYGPEDLGEDDPAEEGLTPDWRIDQTDPIPAVLVISDDSARRKLHIQRIRQTRCLPRYRYRRSFRTGEIIERDLLGYNLIHDPAPLTRRQLLRRKRGVPRKPRA